VQDITPALETLGAEVIKLTEVPVIYHRNDTQMAPAESNRSVTSTIKRTHKNRDAAIF
jgi:hypothetical protein